MLVTANMPTDHYSTSTKRVDQSHSAPTVELYANLALHTFAATVAARRHIARGLVHTKGEIPRRTTAVAAMALVALVLSRRSTWILFPNPTPTKHHYRHLPKELKAEDLVHLQLSPKEV